MNRRTFLALFAAAGATTAALGPRRVEASTFDDTAGAGFPVPAGDLPAEGAHDAQWVNQCYWTRNSWGQRVRVCRRVRRRRCWWRYDAWGRRVRVCN
ncbi:MAG: hypothetical protein ACK4MV_11620 [Beijerinckiaceae bacterium]